MIDAPFLLGWVAASLTVVCVFLAVTRVVDSAVYREGGALALVLHLCLGTFFVPSLPYSWDIQDFHRPAVRLMTGIPTDAHPTVSSFSAWQSVIYATFGAYPRILSTWNSLCAVLVVLPAVDVSKRLYPQLDSAWGLP